MQKNTTTNHTGNKCTCERPDDNTCEYCEKQQEESILKKAKETAWSDYKYTDGELYSNCFKDGFEFGAKWQAERMYSEEDMSEAHFQGWITRERFDDLSPDIIYPKGLDYEEKREYAFNLWFNNLKKK